MNGYPTQFSLWQESAPLGAQTGDAWRPPGITEVSFTPDVATQWQTADVLRGAQADKGLHQAWGVTISREVKHSAYDGLWLNAISDGVVTSAGGTDTRDIIDNVTPPTFGCEFILEDGNQRRFLGMALAHLEWTIESGRIVREEASFAVLQDAAFVGSLRTTERALAASIGGLQARHYFKPGTSWTGPDYTGNRVIAMSSQIIFDRRVSPCQFNAWGKATRHDYAGGWDVLGRTRVQVPESWAQLLKTTRCKAAWRIGQPTDYILIEADVEARLSGHPILGVGQIDHLLDWRAVRAGRSLVNLKKYVQP